MGERIPLTIADTNPAAGTVTVIFQVVGGSTQKLNQKEQGDSIEDFVGPLGKPTEIAKAIVFAADDEAGFMNGQDLHIDGGALI